MIVSLIVAAQLSAFNLGERTDTMTDRVQVILVAEQDGNMVGVGCAKGEKLRGIFSSRRVLRRPSFGNLLRYLARVDTKQAETSIWHYEDRQTAIMVDDFQIAALLDQLQSGTIWRFRGIAYDGDFIDLAFDTSSAKKHVETLLSQCESANVRREIAQRHR